LSDHDWKQAKTKQRNVKLSGQKGAVKAKLNEAAKNRES